MVTVAMMGLIFALVFVWRKSLVAPATLHFLQDFMGIVMVALVRHPH
jgi:membrane protease YdiL (CAAX protease family)